MSHSISGSCLCGGVSFEIRKEHRKVTFCHCSLCRKHNSNSFASVSVRTEHVSIEGEEHIKWYVDSQNASRGFCSSCGTSLFWKSGRPELADYIDVAAGAIDTQEKLSGGKHIFCKSKGSYYEISDGLPKFDEGAD